MPLIPSTAATMPPPILSFFSRLAWINGSPLLSHIELYRRRLFEQFFDERDERGRLRHNLGLFGRGKKNWKTADLVLASLFALITDSEGGNQVYLVANDEGQAADDLTLAKKIIKANPLFEEWLRVKKTTIERRDGQGFLEVLPAQDAIGSHGKTYRLLGVDEIHGYRSWDLLEALAPDPTRPDCQQWITSYASVFHRPGAPLFDLLRQAKTETDSRLLFSWYGADFTTDPAFADVSPERRANPSMDSWGDPDYLAQQQRQLPAHKYRRLHLNLPGLPEGSAFQPEPVMEAIERGMAVRPPVPGIAYVAFVDMSGGSNDDAVLGIGHCNADGLAVLDRLVDQGQRPPFDPRAAVERFVIVLREYGVSTVVSDAYAGEAFKAEFLRHRIECRKSARTKSQLYAALEPALNGHRVVLLDVPKLEQQLLGLIWRGGKIDHPHGEHDDYANVCAGLAQVLAKRQAVDPQFISWCLAAGADEELGPRMPDSF